MGITPEELKGAAVYKGRGCEKCGNSGYKGMTGIFEVMEVDAELRKGILRNLSTDELYRLAEERGMVTMREAALRKLRAGEVDVLEVVKETALR